MREFRNLFQLILYVWTKKGCTDIIYFENYGNYQSILYSNNTNLLIEGTQETIYMLVNTTFVLRSEARCVMHVDLGAVL